MSDHVDAPPEPNRAIAAASQHLSPRLDLARQASDLCQPCFWIWYDPDWADSTKPEEIKRRAVATIRVAGCATIMTPAALHLIPDIEALLRLTLCFFAGYLAGKLGFDAYHWWRYR